jgi:IS30 family transposase
MKQRPRIYYTESQKALMWERWRKGESLQQIAQLFDRNHSSIQRILAETGGISPAPRHRSILALTLAEREEISRALASGHSIRSIATLLERAPSTISREILRNGGQSCYRANQADQAAWNRARRPKTCKLAENPTLARIVATKLHPIPLRSRYRCSGRIGSGVFPPRKWKELRCESGHPTVDGRRAKWGKHGRNGN